MNVIQKDLKDKNRLRGDSAFLNQVDNCQGSADSDYDDEEDYDNKPIADHLEVEDENQLDIFLQDAQDDLQNANNNLMVNNVAIAPLLPGIAQGHQEFPASFDEAPRVLTIHLTIK